MRLFAYPRPPETYMEYIRPAVCHNPICSKTAHAPISCAHDRTARGAAQLRFMEGLVEALMLFRKDCAEKKLTVRILEKTVQKNNGLCSFRNRPCSFRN